MSKDYVLLQKEDIRILVYDKTPDDEPRQMMVNIVVGNEDIMLTRCEFHKLIKLANLVMQAERGIV